MSKNAWFCNSKRNQFLGTVSRTSSYLGKNGLDRLQRNAMVGQFYEPMFFETVYQLLSKLKTLRVRPFEE
jgi:hypothetical protein